MKISIKSIEKLTPVNIPEDSLEQRLTTQVVNVEGIERLGEKYAGILVAQIVEKADHPDSDKMAVYQVNIGAKTVQVVASDKVLQIGDKCPYLPPESKVPFNAHPEKFDGVIKAMELRGVMSEGMLATSKELEFSVDHEKVLVLDTDVEPGTLLSEAYGLDDLVIDAENKGLTNRPETFGLIGFAREVSGIQSLQFTTPKWFSYQHNEYRELYSDLIAELESYKSGTEKTRAGFSVNHQADRLSPRYMLIALDNIEVKSSPVWLQVELMKAGIRSINNVVDITNYLMVLTGQPLHAMDYDKCHPDKDGKINIVVRKAKKGERLTVIDGKSLVLDEEIVVICDDSGPQDLAGVMGGMSSEITRSTKRILLECANFDMYNIRKTSNKTGIKSDAVTRFARSQDPNMCEAVIFKAIEMFKELCGAKVASQLADIVAYPRDPRKVSISVSRLNAHIGLDFDANKIAQILKNVELETEVDKNDSDIMHVLIPTYRQDLNIREDIHEEVARLYGFNNIEITMPTRSIAPTTKNGYMTFTTQMRDSLVSMGAYDLITYNFVGDAMFKKTGQDISLAYHIINSLSPELEYMRTSLTPGLLEKVGMNHSGGVEEFAISEINIAHIKGIIDTENLPYEWKLNSLVFSAIDKIAKTKYEGSPYYTAKLYLDGLLKDLKAKEVRYEALTEISHHNELPVWLHNLITLYNPKLTAVVTYEMESKRYYLGIVGEFTSSVKKAFGLPAYSAGYEINIENLMQIAKAVNTYVEPSKYPATVQDLCFVADRDVPYNAIVKAISGELTKDNNILFKVDPVDIYMSDKASVTKQMTFRISVQGKNEVLNEKYMGDLRTRLSENVLNATGASFKS
jgi:phenylalanyl-tRNA synthetase beta chain